MPCLPPGARVAPIRPACAPIWPPCAPMPTGSAPPVAAARGLPPGAAACPSFALRKARRPWVHLGLVLAAAAALSAARPARAADTTLWTCWLGASQDTVACVLEQAPPRDAAAEAQRAARLDTRLPPLVQSLRVAPLQWRARTVFIPLHGIAFADSALGLLAQSVMCGAVPDCRAVMGSEGDMTEPRFLALLADANDPLLAD